MYVVIRHPRVLCACSVCLVWHFVTSKVPNKAHQQRSWWASCEGTWARFNSVWLRHQRKRRRDRNRLRRTDTWRCSGTRTVAVETLRTWFGDRLMNRWGYMEQLLCQGLQKLDTGNKQLVQHWSWLLVLLLCFLNSLLMLFVWVRMQKVVSLSISLWYVCNSGNMLTTSCLSYECNTSIWPHRREFQGRKFKISVVAIVYICSNLATLAKSYHLKVFRHTVAKGGWDRH